MNHRTPFAVLCTCFAIVWSALLPSRAAEGPGTATIEGRVTNPTTGAIVERARISIEGTDREVFSDADGFFRLTEVRPGKSVCARLSRVFLRSKPP
jgi:hypothetical protein